MGRCPEENRGWSRAMKRRNGGPHAGQRWKGPEHRAPSGAPSPLLLLCKEAQSQLPFGRFSAVRCCCLARGGGGGGLLPPPPRDALLGTHPAQGEPSSRLRPGSPALPRGLQGHARAGCRAAQAMFRMGLQRFCPFDFPSRRELSFSASTGGGADAGSGRKCEDRAESPFPPPERQN